MPLYGTWPDYALRLALALLAGALIGVNREASGHPAGLRTTTLVCLAACVAMIEANILLPTAGKPKDGYVSMDVMRLALGVLTGMGFIGGGAILKRGSLVIGVTTAATLWATTIIGLAFGGGQIALGAVATALVLLVVWGMEPLDKLLPKLERATLCLVGTPDAAALAVDAARLGVTSVTLLEREWMDERRRLSTTYEVAYVDRHGPPIAAVQQLAAEPGVLELAWRRVAEG